MCFSAPASFIASGGLAVLGGSTLVMAKKHDKILATVPLLFAAQQGIEGFQWIALNHGTTSPTAGYAFLFFAFIVWPIYVPTLVYILDKEKRKIVMWFIFLGVGVAAYFLRLLLTETLVVSEMRSCVSYTFNFPFENLIVVPYLIAIFGSLFASDNKIFRRFGVLTAGLAYISWLFYTVAFTSVWCFFAAIASSIIFIHIMYRRKTT